MPLFLFQPSSAPGREGGPAPQPASPAPATEGQPTPVGPPPDGGFFGGSGLTFLLPIAVLMVFVLFQNRGTAKKQKALEDSLKVGDRVLTGAGIVGKISELGDRTVRLEVAPGVHVTFLKTAIQGTDPTVKKEEPKKDDTKGKDKDEPKSKEPKANEKDAKDK